MTSPRVLKRRRWLLGISLVAAVIILALNILSRYGFVRLVAFCPAPNSACGIYVYSGLVGADYGVVEDFDVRKNSQRFWRSSPSWPASVPFFYPGRTSHMPVENFVCRVHLYKAKRTSDHDSNTWYLVFPIWIPMTLFLAYPLLTVYRGIFRRWWRFERGLCPNCAYDLHGNTSGRCSECGEVRPCMRAIE